MTSYSNFFRSILLSGNKNNKWRFATIASSVGLSTAALLWYQRQYQADSYSIHLKRYPASSEYPQLNKHSNLLARHLTPQLYAKLRDRVTSSGYTIDDVIQVGVDNPGSPSRQYFGVSAGDEESYKIFRELYDPLVHEKFDHKTDERQQHDIDYSKLRYPFENDSNVDLNKYILSSRIRITRNLSGFTFPTFSTRAERRQVEKKFSQIFDQFSKTEPLFNGGFHRLSTISERLQEKLSSDGVFLFKPQTMSWLSSGVSRDWPDGRALYVNNEKTIFAWINQKDHLRLISWSTNNSKHAIRSVIKNFFQGLSTFEQILTKNGLSFAHDDHFGYLTSCPANLGTGLKLNVFLKLPNLTKDARLAGIAKDLNLNIEEIMDPDVETFKNCVDISNKDRIGKTEIEIVQQVLDGAAKLIEIERSLESGEKLDDYFRKK